ncbi:MAG: hypothetical protein WBF71_15105 [Microthrixaceae bacterium]
MEDSPEPFYIYVLAISCCGFVCGYLMTGSVPRIAGLLSVGPLLLAGFTVSQGDGDGLWILIYPILVFVSGLVFLLALLGRKGAASGLATSFLKHRSDVNRGLPCCWGQRSGVTDPKLLVIVSRLSTNLVRLVTRQAGDEFWERDAMSRRRFYAIGLMVGGLAFVAAPVTDVAAAAISLSQPVSSPSRSEPGYATVGDVPGLESDTFGPVKVVPPVEQVDSFDGPVLAVGEVVPDEAATVGAEIVGDRTEFSQSFRRSDGLLELRVSPEPIAYDAGGGEFELIDTSVERLDGGFEAARNKFQVSFGRSDQGVSVNLPSGATMVSRPALLDGVAMKVPVAPTVDGDDDSVVWYRQVWPGVDVRYTVRATGLSEDVVYTSAPSGAGAVTFAVTGAELDPAWSLPVEPTAVDGASEVPRGESVVSETLGKQADLGRRSMDPVAEQQELRLLAAGERPAGALSSLVARGRLGSEVSFGPVVVMSGVNADFVDDRVATPLVRSEVTSPAESLVEVSVDPSWIQSLPEEAFPVVVDPDVTVGSAGWVSYLGGTTTQCGSGSPYCGMRAGHPMIPGLGWFDLAVDWDLEFGVIRVDLWALRLGQQEACRGDRNSEQDNRAHRVNGGALD